MMIARGPIWDSRRWPALVVGAAIIVFRMIAWEMHETLPDPSWGLALYNTGVMMAIWLIATGLLGVGRRHPDRPSKQPSYLAEESYPLYILHQTVIVVLAYYIVRLPGPWAVQWVALLAAVVAVTFGAYEVVRRVGVLRFLFGMRGKPKAASAAPATADS